MDKFVLGGAQVLGKVLHWVIRYEVQSRGSLHAHIILWIDSSDVDRVTQEITACVPTQWDETSANFVRPADPAEARLYDIVMRKQMHICKPGLCLDQSMCKSGYFFDSHSGLPVLDPVTNRWKYFRPGYKHRNIVSYHPVLLYLLNNHMNIQRVTNANWSYYLLKYAIKTELVGELDLDSTLGNRLGLDGLTDQQLRLLSAAVLSHPVSPCEAALTCLQIPVIQRSEAITFIDSSPPELRTHHFSKWAIRPTIPAVDLYCGRPSVLAPVTFVDYFKQYIIKFAEHTGERTNFVGRDAFGRFVYARTRASQVLQFPSSHESGSLILHPIVTERFVRLRK
jgi:hypothetical protein